MAYYTNFTLIIDASKSTYNKKYIENEVAHNLYYHLSGEIYDSDKLTCNEIFDTDSMTFHSHDDFFIQQSLIYKNVLFILLGVGENSIDNDGTVNDVWKTYYLNGDSYKIIPELTWYEPDIDFFNYE